MARRRLDDTVALDKEPLSPSDGPNSVSVSIRPIDNGFISSHSREHANGEYSHEERFHKEKPSVEDIVVGHKHRAARNTVNHLKGAVSLLKGRR